MTSPVYPPPPYPLFPGYMGDAWGFFLCKIRHVFYPSPFAAKTTPMELRAFLRRDKDLAQKVEGACGVNWEALPEVWRPNEQGEFVVALAGMAHIRGSESMCVAALSTVIFHGDAWRIEPGILEEWGAWSQYTRPSAPMVRH